jgi:hypothetical protein
MKKAPANQVKINENLMFNINIFCVFCSSLYNGLFVHVYVVVKIPNKKIYLIIILKFILHIRCKIEENKNTIEKFFFQNLFIDFL